MSETGTPLVSIIMAAKNTEPYIKDCLDSILAQTYGHWELLVANDHSTDRTRQILEEYASSDARVRVFDSHRPRLIPTLQVAYAEAQGELINRMDSDDRMPHDKLEVLVKHWLPHGKGTIIAGGTEHFVDEGEVGGGFRRYELWLNEVARHGTHYQQIYQECVIPSHCWIIHKEDFDRVGAFDPIVYPEDYDLCFRFYRAGLRVIGIDKILHYWRDRSDRISRTWEEYEDNRYFDLKLRYFYELDRDRARPMVVWGAGRNGKELVKLILEREKEVHWVCDNDQKIGKDIYGVRMQHYSAIEDLANPQILVVVTSLDDRKAIHDQLSTWAKQPVKDYWFFL